jgi:hypothetical protein
LAFIAYRRATCAAETPPQLSESRSNASLHSTNAASSASQP